MRLDSRSGNLSALIFTMILGFAILGYQNYAAEKLREKRIAEWREREQAKETAPVTDWYVLRGINLDNFIEGEDPPVAFDSEVKKPFNLKWTVQAHKVDAEPGYPPVCATGATYFRTPSDNRGLSIIPWSELWRRNPCAIGPGKYVLKAHAVLHIVGYPTKETDRISNIFTVLPKGSETYVKPERIEQLEKAQELLDNPIPLVPNPE